MRGIASGGAGKAGGAETRRRRGSDHLCRPVDGRHDGGRVPEAGARPAPVCQARAADRLGRPGGAFAGFDHAGDDVRVDRLLHPQAVYVAG